MESVSAAACVTGTTSTGTTGTGTGTGAGTGAGAELCLAGYSPHYEDLYCSSFYCGGQQKAVKTPLSSGPLSCCKCIPR